LTTLGIAVSAVDDEQRLHGRISDWADVFWPHRSFAARRRPAVV